MEDQKGFKISQYACAVLLIVSSIALVAPHLLESPRAAPPLHQGRVLQIGIFLVVFQINPH